MSTTLACRVGVGRCATLVAVLDGLARVTTRQLVLIRHAKAGEGAVDRDRSLADRGVAEAPAAGRWLWQQGPLRSRAVKARTQAINQLRALIVTAPDDLRQRLTGLSTTALSAACTRLRPTSSDTTATAATKTAMRALARRITTLTAEADDLRSQLRTLVHTTAPTLIDLLGVGVDTAATLLTAAGDNPDRIRSDGSFTHLCGAAPLPASSGRTDRHRLNRGGNRDANSALHIVAVVRLRHCHRTCNYTTRRTTQGLSKKDILRCLKRCIARDVRTAILTDLNGHAPQPPRHQQAA